MTNSKNKNTAILVAIFFVSTLLFLSCKKTSNKIEDVEFDLAVAETDTVYIDTTLDSTSATENFYKLSVNILNDYYRVACEENDVLLDDVQSVTLKSSEAIYLSPSSGSFSDFKNIRQYAHDDGLAATDLMASIESISGTPQSLTLAPSSNDLKKYFRLQYLPTQILLGRQTPLLDTASVKFKFVFHVKGQTH